MISVSAEIFRYGRRNFLTKSMNKKILLQELLDLDILSSDSIQEMLMKSKREKVLESHPYAITPPSANSKRWQTYYKAESGGRKLLRAPTEQALLDKLVTIYSDNQHIDNLTFNGLYEEWLVYQIPNTNSPNTITRYKQLYKKYLEPSVLNNKKVKDIDELTLESECNRIVKSHNLKRKEWGNIKTILSKMYKFALKKGYVTVNPLLSVEISIKFRQEVKKPSHSQTYNTDELRKLNDYLDKMYSETHDSSYLAVKLNFLLGLRVGELVALKWDDIDYEKHSLHVIREEIRNQELQQVQVVNHTKTNCDRYVTLVPKAITLLKKLNRESDYVFTRNGERLTARQIAYVLEKYAERNGVITKSTHKMRKTYASNLNAAGVPIDAIREQLGHSSLETTYSYIYNPLTEQETYNLISKAL